MANTGQFNVCCTGKLSIELHRPGLLGMFRQPAKARCLHFSVQGLQVETDADFRVGERLILDLQVNDLRVEELHGVVQTVSSTEDGHYYDIAFVLDKKRASNTLHCLRHLDNHLRGSSAPSRA